MSGLNNTFVGERGGLERSFLMSSPLGCVVISRRQGTVFMVNSVTLSTAAITQHQVLFLFFSFLLSSSFFSLLYLG